MRVFNSGLFIFYKLLIFLCSLYEGDGQLVPYTLGNATVMVDLTEIGANKGLIDFLQKGLPNRSGYQNPISMDNEKSSVDVFGNSDFRRKGEIVSLSLLKDKESKPVEINDFPDILTTQYDNLIDETKTSKIYNIDMTTSFNVQEEFGNVDSTTNYSNDNIEEHVIISSNKTTTSSNQNIGAHPYNTFEFFLNENDVEKSNEIQKFDIPNSVYDHSELSYNAIPTLHKGNFLDDIVSTTLLPPTEMVSTEEGDTTLDVKNVLLLPDDITKKSSEVDSPTNSNVETTTYFQNEIRPGKNNENIKITRTKTKTKIDVDYIEAMINSLPKNTPNDKETEELNTTVSPESTSEMINNKIISSLTTEANSNSHTYDTTSQFDESTVAEIKQTSSAHQIDLNSNKSTSNHDFQVLNSIMSAISTVNQKKNQNHSTDTPELFETLLPSTEIPVHTDSKMPSEVTEMFGIEFISEEPAHDILIEENQVIGSFDKKDEVPESIVNSSNFDEVIGFEEQNISKYIPKTNKTQLDNSIFEENDIDKETEKMELQTITTSAQPVLNSAEVTTNNPGIIGSLFGSLQNMIYNPFSSVVSRPSSFDSDDSEQVSIPGGNTANLYYSTDLRNSPIAGQDAGGVYINNQKVNISNSNQIDGLKSWFNKDPIEIFDPNNSQKNSLFGGSTETKVPTIHKNYADKDTIQGINNNYNNVPTNIPTNDPLRTSSGVSNAFAGDKKPNFGNPLFSNNANASLGAMFNLRDTNSDQSGLSTKFITSEISPIAGTSVSTSTSEVIVVAAEDLFGPDTQESSPPISPVGLSTTPSPNISTDTQSTVMGLPGAVLHSATPDIFYKSTCRCGLRFMDTKIVGGQTTSIEKYPWMVGLTRAIDHFTFCGGSIINDLYILTAAHCVNGLDVSELYVRIGETSRNGPAVKAYISEAIIHSKFGDPPTKYDIALLKLREKLYFSQNVLPICLPDVSSNEKYGNTKGIVAGWGHTSSGGDVSDTLQEVQVDIMTKKECRKKSNYNRKDIHTKVLCASAPNKDSCQGDSGGPLMSMSKNYYEQIGLVSWGIGCAEKVYPGVYTRITSYLQWILKNSNEGTFCSKEPVKREVDTTKAPKNKTTIITETTITDGFSTQNLPTHTTVVKFQNSNINNDKPNRVIIRPITSEGDTVTSTPIIKVLNKGKGTTVNKKPNQDFTNAEPIKIPVFLPAKSKKKGNRRKNAIKQKKGSKNHRKTTKKNQKTRDTFSNTDPILKLVSGKKSDRKNNNGKKHSKNDEFKLKLPLLKRKQVKRSSSKNSKNQRKPQKNGKKRKNRQEDIQVSRIGLNSPAESNKAIKTDSKIQLEQSPGLNPENAILEFISKYIGSDSPTNKETGTEETNQATPQKRENEEDEKPKRRKRPLVRGLNRN